MPLYKTTSPIGYGSKEDGDWLRKEEIALSKEINGEKFIFTDLDMPPIVRLSGGEDKIMPGNMKMTPIEKSHQGAGPGWNTKRPKA